MYCELPSNCEKVLKDLVEYDGAVSGYWFKKYDYNKMNQREIAECEGIVKQLESYGYVELSWSDEGPPIILFVSNEARTYFENKVKAEKNQKRMNRREFKIAVISAIVGAIVGLIPYFITLIMSNN